MSDDLSIPSPTYRIPRQRRGMDPMTRKLALIACGLGGALVVVVGGYTLIGQRSREVPVVHADSGPIRVKPANPGGMQIAGAGEDILSGGGPGSADKLAPPPETPDPQALRAPPPPPAKPAPVIAATPTPLPTPAIAQTAPKPAVAQAALKPAESPDKRAALAAAAPRAAPAGKDTLVQFAAVRSEDAAREEWDRLAHRMPDLLKARRLSISKIERDGHALWRVRTGGFSDVGEATTFCERVRAKGGGCSVADF